MREQLMKTFDEIYILNLHGNSKKRERTPDGSKDENVFDIQQGVAVGIFIKSNNKQEKAIVRHSEFWGTREDKYSLLLDHDVQNTNWKVLSPESPFKLFVPQNNGLLNEYQTGHKINDIFPIGSVGIVTGQDRNTIGFKKEQTIDLALENSLSDHSIEPILYRPFDTRMIVYDSRVVVRMRSEVMKQMLIGSNIGIAIPRRVETVGPWQHIMVSEKILEHVAVSLKTIDSLLPLYLYQSSPEISSRQDQFAESPLKYPIKNGRIPNLNPDFVSAFASRLGLQFVSDGHGDLSTKFGPEDIFHYIYAVFHSPTYRQRYAEFLKIDFPRVPMTSSPELFRKLCILGEELVALHLLESPYLSQLVTRYPVVGDNIVEKGFPKFVAYEEGAPGYVYINKSQYFEGVPKEVWEFHVGGYQVCEKWLKDRRGRQLSFDDLMHYQKVVVALKETARLMAEIDKAIPGWPIK
jgi:predicted helicase